ncbi:glycoside hydrolase family 43 protein [Hymenobacter convexus]|uniref:glycoside hydrolase family 43 protein n=1 Tax=Hymenobacter sp. CA1UV-4 TaxID=3063782 RepID=UPI00350FF785
MNMRTNWLAFLFAILLPTLAAAQPARSIRLQVPLDSIQLSDPFILADKKTHLYYMTGTGGLLWKSRDLKRWDGPYAVAQPDPASWMGPKPMIWAAEIHPYKGKYYYFATFTNEALKISATDGRQLDRRACHVLVSDRPDGPYKPMRDATYLPANRLTLDATLWVEKDQPYLVYCDEWLNDMNGTVEKIALKPDLSGTTGEAQVLFRATDSPWSREDPRSGPARPNKVTDGPYVFRTGTGRLGMVWTSWIYDVYTQGVAYSTSGTLAGPWTQEPSPITPPNFGHGMLFKSFEGKSLMAIHSHRSEGGRYIRVPHLFEVDLTGDKLVLGKAYRP